LLFLNDTAVLIAFLLGEARLIFSDAIFSFKFSLPKLFIGNPERHVRKLHTVAASNNRDHASQSRLLLLVRAAYIFVLRAHPVRGESHNQRHIFLFFAHIPFVVNHTINATPPERLQ